MCLCHCSKDMTIERLVGRCCSARNGVVSWLVVYFEDFLAVHIEFRESFLVFFRPGQLNIPGCSISMIKLVFRSTPDFLSNLAHVHTGSLLTFWYTMGRVARYKKEKSFRDPHE